MVDDDPVAIVREFAGGYVPASKPTGIVHELWFWWCWLQRNASRYRDPRPLGKQFMALVKDVPRPVVANLGSGALNLIGEVGVEVRPSDYLARGYAEMHARLGITPTCSIEYQDMTALTYPDEMFDLVVCQNAVDHSADPRRAVREMVRVCKPGGWIYLNHMQHEGKRMRYSGLHQWNIDAVGDDCEIWSRHRECVFRLSDIVPVWSHSCGLKRIVSVAQRA